MKRRICVDHTADTGVGWHWVGVGVNTSAFGLPILSMLIFFFVNLMGIEYASYYCLAQAVKTDPEVCSADFAIPASVVAYVEIQDPAAAIELILQHSLTENLLELEQVKMGLASPEMAVAKIIIGTLEEQLQKSWPEMIEIVTKQGASIAWDQKSQGVIFVSRAESGHGLSEIVKAILGWVNLEARMNQRAKPYQGEDYRGHRILKFRNAAIARVDDWFLASNQIELVKQTMDPLIDGPNLSETGATIGLAAYPSYQRARQMHPPNKAAWAYFDLKAIRQAGLAPELFSGRMPQPIIELLFGGIGEALPEADFLAVGVTLNEDQMHAEITLSQPATPSSEARKYFYATEPDSKRSFVIECDQMIARIAGRRDLAAWWLAKENLYEENVIAQMALVDSQFTTILSGLNFGEDFLAALEPCLQILVANQPNHNPDVPLKLPAFALVGRLKEPAEMKRRLRIAFNSVIGFANIQGGMNGMPPLDFMTESADGIELTSATYVLDSRAAQSQVPLDLSPSIAFASDFFILSSTRELAVELGKKCLSDTSELSSTNNLLAEISIPMLAIALGKNREQWIVQNMLEEGNNRSTAEQNINQLLEILQQFERVSTQLDVHPEVLKLKTQIRFQTLAPSGEK
jgi:hypothetical protein